MTLTSEQLSVVNLVSGRHLVLAPSGSPKAVLEKVRHLLDGGIAENVAILVRTNREADDCECLVRGLGYRTVKVSGHDLFAYPLMRDFLDFVSLFAEKPPRTAWASLVRRFADGIYRSSEARYFVRLESAADAEHEETIRAILAKKNLPEDYERRLRTILFVRARRKM